MLILLYDGLIGYQENIKLCWLLLHDGQIGQHLLVDYYFMMEKKVYKGKLYYADYYFLNVSYKAYFAHLLCLSSAIDRAYHSSIPKSSVHCIHPVNLGKELWNGRYVYIQRGLMWATIIIPPFPPPLLGYIMMIPNVNLPLFEYNLHYKSFLFHGINIVMQSWNILSNTVGTHSF